MSGTDSAPVKDTQSSGPVTELARDMRLFDITMVGVGAMIGAGIFALTGIAAGHAGPALILAFCLNGVLTLMTAMVYAELGSAIPAAVASFPQLIVTVPLTYPFWNSSSRSSSIRRERYITR